MKINKERAYTFVTTVLQYYNLYSLLLPLKESYFSY